MKHFAYSLSIAGLVASLGTGAFAAADADPATLTCADFTAMSADEQRSALDGIHAMDAESGAADDVGMDTDNTDASSGSADAGTDLSADTATGSSSDASPDTSDAGTDASDAGTDAGATASDTDVSDSSDVSTDPEVLDAISACEGNDEALVSDTIGS